MVDFLPAVDMVVIQQLKAAHEIVGDDEIS